MDQGIESLSDVEIGEVYSTSSNSIYTLPHKIT
jgi:hypothetical protein